MDNTQLKPIDELDQIIADELNKTIEKFKNKFGLEEIGYKRGLKFALKAIYGARLKLEKLWNTRTAPQVVVPPIEWEEESNGDLYAICYANRDCTVLLAEFNIGKVRGGGWELSTDDGHHEGYYSTLDNAKSKAYDILVDIVTEMVNTYVK